MVLVRDGKTVVGASSALPLKAEQAELRAPWEAAGLDISTWTLERSGRIKEEVLPTKGTAAPSFYYQTTLDALRNDGDLMTTLDVLARQVGILGIFSDWSGTVSYYASCMGLK